MLKIDFLDQKKVQTNKMWFLQRLFPEGIVFECRRGGKLPSYVHVKCCEFLFLWNASDFHSIGLNVRILIEIFHIRVECHLTIGSLMLFDNSTWKSQNWNDVTPTTVIQSPSKVTFFTTKKHCFIYLGNVILLTLQMNSRGCRKRFGQSQNSNLWRF